MVWTLFVFSTNEYWGYSGNQENLHARKIYSRT